MTSAAKRTILRSVHILVGLPLIGFIYGPPAEVEQYRYMFQYVLFPLLVLSGVLLWKGHVVQRLFSRGSN